MLWEILSRHDIKIEIRDSLTEKETEVLKATGHLYMKDGRLYWERIHYSNRGGTFKFDK